MQPTVPFAPEPPEPPAAPPEYPPAAWAQLSPRAQEQVREWYDHHRHTLLRQLWHLLLTPGPTRPQPTGRELGANLLILGYLLRIPPLDTANAENIRCGWRIQRGIISAQTAALRRRLHTLNPRIRLRNEDQARRKKNNS